MGKSVEKKIQCIDCGKKTAKYYTVATNKGKIYKFTGAFAPVNQILGLLNF